MKLIQVMFSRPLKPLSDCREIRVTWVDKAWKLKKGNQVRFKDEKALWKVDEIYTQELEAIDLDKKWGLALPKTQRTER